MEDDESYVADVEDVALVIETVVESLRDRAAFASEVGRARLARLLRAAAPHDLRHRRISLLHARNVPWAQIAQFVGQRNLSVTADTYSHVLMNETEVDYATLLAA